MGVEIPKSSREWENDNVWFICQTANEVNTKLIVLLNFDSDKWAGISNKNKLLSICNYVPKIQHDDIGGAYYKLQKYSKKGPPYIFDMTKETL